MNELVSKSENAMTAKEIANVLGVTKMTVRNVISKLGIKVHLYRNVSNNKTECFDLSIY